MDGPLLGACASLHIFQPGTRSERNLEARLFVALTNLAPVCLTDCLQTPAGSSTGSAVGVACGFAPVSLGTETSGSVVSPAAAAALYALKLTPGSVPLAGIMEVTACFDTVGAFGKSALDVALVCDAIPTSKDSSNLASFASSVNLKDISVGFVDIEEWRLPAHTQVGDPKYFEQTVKPLSSCNIYQPLTVRRLGSTRKQKMSCARMG